jgi:hypothetical protein
MYVTFSFTEGQIVIRKPVKFIMSSMNEKTDPSHSQTDVVIYSRMCE